MEITQLVEQNPTLLRLGLHLEYNDARHRVATHLQRNIDTSKYDCKNNGYKIISISGLEYLSVFIKSLFKSFDSILFHNHL